MNFSRLLHSSNRIFYNETICVSVQKKLVLFGKFAKRIKPKDGLRQDWIAYGNSNNTPLSWKFLVYFLQDVQTVCHFRYENLNLCKILRQNQNMLCSLAGRIWINNIEWLTLVTYTNSIEKVLTCKKREINIRKN